MLLLSTSCPRFSLPALLLSVYDSPTQGMRLLPVYSLLWQLPLLSDSFTGPALNRVEPADDARGHGYVPYSETQVHDAAASYPNLQRCDELRSLQRNAISVPFAACRR